MKKVLLSSIVFILVLAIFYSFFTVTIRQDELAVILRFGKPVKVISEPGIFLKLVYPINNVVKFDARLKLLQPRPSEFLTQDKKNLILENCISYKITDPIQFMKTVRDQTGAEVRLTDLLSSHTGLLLGVRELSEIVNTDTTKLRFEQMNTELTRLLRQDSKDLGVDIQQVFIKRVMLPQQNVLAVYDRMRAERNRIAKKYLAEGEEEAQQIRAEADRLSRTLIAEAQKEAEIIMGQADAEAMEIYGAAYRKNPRFFRFLRSLEAYEQIFDENSVIILDEDSPILKTLFSGGDVAK
ncbi:MAG: protease modulator HflC [candidate division Zixibacteria bacterium]|nr:protease modulator HflC [candidate division Zixibacteria bacterium]